MTNSPLARSRDEDPVDPGQGVGRVVAVVGGGMDQPPRVGHQDRGRDPLAGHVGDDEADAPAPVPEPEDVVEVATDLARRLVALAISQPASSGNGGA